MKKYTIIYPVISLCIYFLSSMLAYSQVEVWMAKGDKAIYQKNFKEAIVDFSRALDHDPNNTKAIYNRGLAYLYSEQYNEALADFSRFIELKPEDADGYNNRGLTYGYIGNVDAAIADFDKSLQLDPNYAEGYLNRGSAYVSNRNYPAALKDFDKAIKFNDKNPEIYFQRGRIHYKQKNYKKAVQDFTKAMDLGLKHSKVYYNRGNSYFKDKIYDKAIKDYTKALELDPKDTEARNNRAMAYDLSGNQSKASEDRKKLLLLAGLPDPNKIKYKKFQHPSGIMSIDMPDNWYMKSGVEGDLYEMTVTQETLSDVKQPYTVGVRLTYNKNMKNIYPAAKNEMDILNFWKGSAAKNAGDYQTYDVLMQKSMHIGSWTGFYNKSRIQIGKDDEPLGLFELVLANKDNLVWAYFQSPVKQFEYYKAIFEKAMKTVVLK
jgi:tetratricopeptide (TPR) repeat protein